MNSVDSDAQRLLSLIVRAAQLDASQHGARHDLLRQVSALLWWLEPDAPPRTIANLLACLSLPLEQWLDSRLRQGYEGALKFADEPSMLCNAIALESNPRVGWERIQQIVKNVRDLCRTRPHGADEYRLFRMFLIDHGVVDADRSLDFLIPLQVSFNSLYEPIPEHLIRAGQVYLCPSCGWPMEIHRHAVSCGAHWCEQTFGIAQWMEEELVSVKTSKVIPPQPAQNKYRLTPALWKFTLIPGLLERRLRDGITRLGVPVELWPDVDDADLRFSVAGESYSLDAKVWHSPGHLGHHLQNTAHADAMIVIPDYQVQYVSMLNEQCYPRQIMSETQCLRWVKIHANPN
ncbi:hypothetical protein OSW16_13455 [Pseudomonas putida]|uniref:restriction endonuclease-related protein n=1 Tax=Pseudomonas putida TaxID=303 RepID=UPI00226E0E7F|nr:hypothetical protein [Pseudomonas putida]WAC00599.1 hypothetical protein OSW16_13455 [Pseudomonas putida]